MQVRPLHSARQPDYPTAEVVMADPRLFISTWRPPRRWRKLIAPAGCLLVGGGLAAAVVVPMTMSPTMGVICPAPAFTEAGAISIVLDEMRLAGYRLAPATAPLDGIEVDAVDPTGTIGVEYLDLYNHGSDPSDADFEDAWLNGRRHLRLPLPPAGSSQPDNVPTDAAGDDGAAVGLFDAMTEAELRQQVRDFIQWLESQQ